MGIVLIKLKMWEIFLNNYDIIFVMKNFSKILKIILLILLIFISFLIFIVITKPTTYHVAKGDGMAPTIKKGDTFIVDKRIKDFKRGDIILYKIPLEGEYFQRIIALPNDKIEIMRNNKGITEVYLNNKLLDEPYKIKKKEASLHPKAVQMKPLIVKDDHYFVMGDDRDLSFDSRFFGPLHKWFIVGKVVEN